MRRTVLWIVGIVVLVAALAFPGLGMLRNDSAAGASVSNRVTAETSSEQAAASPSGPTGGARVGAATALLLLGIGAVAVTAWRRSPGRVA